MCARVVVWSEWCVLPSSPSSPERPAKRKENKRTFAKKLVVCTVHLSPQGQAPLWYFPLSQKDYTLEHKKTRAMTTRMY